MFAGVYDHDVSTPLTYSGFEPGADIELGWRGERIESWRAVGRPRPYVFASANTAGATNFAAAGLSWRFGARGVAYGIAGGLFFSIGDISVKIATQGGARTAFAVGVVLGYSLGTALLQLGYQKGGALTVAGLATLLTNALPIAAGSVLLGEPVPSGALGALRILAFAAVTAGAILLARTARS